MAILVSNEPLRVYVCICVSTSDILPFEKAILLLKQEEQLRLCMPRYTNVYTIYIRVFICLLYAAVRCWL